LVEAVHMARSATGRDRVVVSGAVDRRYVKTLQTYAAGPGFYIDVVPHADGMTVVPEIGDDVAAVVVQYPNYFAILGRAREVFDAARAGGARAVEVFDPLSLGVLQPPGELGADIAIAEGQVLGNHLSYGGPYLGVIAARMQDVRRMPGRI